MTLFIGMSKKQFFLVSFFPCLLISTVELSILASKEKKIDRLITNICDQLYNHDESDPIENAKWEQLCQSWIQLNYQHQQTEDEMIDRKFYVENIRIIRKISKRIVSVKDEFNLIKNDQ